MGKFYLNIVSHQDKTVLCKHINSVFVWTVKVALSSYYPRIEFVVVVVKV